MRSMNRNKRQIYYALLIREGVTLDEYGNETGDPTLEYGNAVALQCNISAATGADAVQAFGNFTNYNRTMCVTDRGCPIDEKAIVWFGRDPAKEPHNYIVTRKADSKNGILYALREVTVT